MIDFNLIYSILDFKYLSFKDFLLLKTPNVKYLVRINNEPHPLKRLILINFCY